MDIAGLNYLYQELDKLQAMLAAQDSYYTKGAEVFYPEAEDYYFYAGVDEAKGAIIAAV